ncbi:hypothetical protein KKD19_02650 [Patescibacteria group bacterium]|nr:hypothetical protein [Patescibacteria group bacterium]MBU4512119.1 hypothetical protein [Patescibacteria group bacterium]MCG2692524.1 hypothetical protein [Candidatus Parcubacteria bacterium]
MMLDNFINRRSNRVSLWLYIIGLVFGVWGLWNHNSVAILLALILAGLSHILLKRAQKKQGLNKSNYSSGTQKSRGSRLAGNGAEALVSRPKIAEPLSSTGEDLSAPVETGEAEPEIYDFEEELKRAPEKINIKVNQ